MEDLVRLNMSNGTDGFGLNRFVSVLVRFNSRLYGCSA
jgi:hypothetical protein